MPRDSHSGVVFMIARRGIASHTCRHLAANHVRTAPHPQAGARQAKERVMSDGWRMREVGWGCDIEWHGVFRGTDLDPREVGYCLTCDREVLTILTR